MLLSLPGQPLAILQKSIGVQIRSKLRQAWKKSADLLFRSRLSACYLGLIFTHRSSVPELNPYARFLDGRPVAEILVSTPGALEALTEAIGSERLAFSPAPGKWTPAEILCHMADCEVAFGFRLRQTLAEDHHVLQPFDQEKWAATYPSVTAQQALAAFTAMREWNLILIRNAPQGAAKKPVTHPERGIMTFATITETMAGHDLNHIAQLEKLAGS
jgi:DinB superfamily